MKKLKVFATASLICLLAASCQYIGNITRVGTGIAVATGAMEEDRAQEINQQADALAKSFQEITPEQEYYIGRAVSAVVLNDYAPYDNKKANKYINVVGQSLALASGRPFTFGGYHFLILDSKEINAFAAPSGLIFVTRGIFKCAANEDEVAAILAHEIAHVELKHGLQSIQKNRLTTALADIAVSAAEHSKNERLAELSREFGGSIKDITSTLVNVGYSRAFEREADESAVMMLQSLGYDPKALIRVLRKMAFWQIWRREGFSKTHPRPWSRIGNIRREISGTDYTQEVPRERRVRYRVAMKKVRP